MQNFKSLKVWEKSHELTLAVYKATTNFPKDELYGLTSQIRRASASIPANIAEGCGIQVRWRNPSQPGESVQAPPCRFYHLLLAHDLDLLRDGEYKLLENQAVELKRMLSSFISKLRA